MNFVYDNIKQVIAFAILVFAILLYSQWDEKNINEKIYSDYGIAKALTVRYESGVRGSSRLVYAFTVDDSTFYGSIRVTAKFWDSSAPPTGQSCIVHYSCVDPNLNIIFLKQPWVNGMIEKTCVATPTRKPE